MTVGLKRQYSFDGWAKRAIFGLTVGLKPLIMPFVSWGKKYEAAKKEAHRVSFRVTIFLVSWKQTQWAAYIPFILFALVLFRKYYAPLICSASFIRP